MKNTIHKYFALCLSLRRSTATSLQLPPSPRLSILTAIALILSASPLHAVTVSPKGVNVKSFSATTVFLTFVGLNNQVPAEGLWCGEINPDQSCVSDTIFGRLPRRSNLARLSGTNNYTDIMTIPASVTRRAYQDAVRGNNSDFFYVRRFISKNGQPDEYVAVTCRLSGGGARVPLSLTNVELKFSGDKPVPAIAVGETLPKFGAEITYNGTGRLKGRWEVVLPGDPLPTQRDLLTEATLPIEERPLQRRYTQLERFDLFLQPTGKVFLPGPDPDTLPKGSNGLHLILLRIEATDDREADSDIGAGVVNSGGVAGFPLPVLRYFITPNESGLQLLSPKSNAQLSTQQPIEFKWQAVTGAASYKLEVKSQDKLILSALIAPDTNSYMAPPWLKETKERSLTWKVQALKADGSPLLESQPQNLQLFR